MVMNRLKNVGNRLKVIKEKNEVPKKKEVIEFFSSKSVAEMEQLFEDNFTILSDADRQLLKHITLGVHALLKSEKVKHRKKEK